jgi:hypothetical protein
LKEVTVKVIGDLKQSQSSEMLVEAINTACSSKAEKVLAAHKLQSGNILVTAAVMRQKS